MLQVTNPLISVVMCVYNGEKYINEAIKSILAQTITDFEFIIINDGSTDGTEEIIVSSLDPRIIYVKNDHNLGLIKSLNKGLELVKGKYIARMDADDISLPERFEKQISIFNSPRQVDIVNINYYILSEDGTNYKSQKTVMTIDSETLKYLIPIQNFICHPGVMVKSELLKKYKYSDELSTVHIEDFDLWNRMLKDGCTCYTIDDYLLLYRDNSHSINHIYKSLQVERMSLLCNNTLKKVFDYTFDMGSLHVLLGEGGNIGYSAIVKLNAEIYAYSEFLKKQYSISTFVQKEIGYWRKQKMVLIALKSLKNTAFIKKMGVLIFLFLHLNWFGTQAVRTLITKSIYTRRWVRP